MVQYSLCVLLMDPFLRLIKSDDEFSLFGVVIFKRVHDEFIQKCRDHKYLFCSTDHSIRRFKLDLGS